MDPQKQYRQQRTRSARDRCLALINFLKKFDKQVQACPATHLVVRAYKHALKRLYTRFEDLGRQPTLATLTEEFLSDRIDHYAGYIRWIAHLVGQIDNADVGSVPAELASTLRRQIKKHFPKGELIIVSTPDLNYSIYDIREDLDRTFQGLDSKLPDDFPSEIFRISIPAVEYDQALLHCMLAHEIGHPLYRKNKLRGKILPISIDDSSLDDVYKAFKKEQENTQDRVQTEIPFTEVQFKALVSRVVHEIMSQWIGEIAADLYGLMIFGPAYILSFFYFSSAIERIDNASFSHPPPRLRCRNLLSFMKERMKDKYKLEYLKKFTRTAIDMLDVVSNKRAQNLGIVFEVAVNSIQKEEILQRICDGVQNSLSKKEKYLPEQYKEEVDELVDLINAMVVPVETRQCNEYRLASLPGILNAGWECFLEGLTEYKEHLPPDKKANSFQVALQFNRFLMKSIELNDVKRSWEEERNAAISQPDQRTNL